MMGLRRLLTIAWVFCKYRLDLLVDASAVSGPPSWLLKMGPWRLFSKPEQSEAERLRLALEELGPIFVKFGQLLSTRPDILPEPLAVELAKLQDTVPPFPKEESKAIVEQQLGKPVSQLFEHFDPDPMASASIAQVHAARLQGGIDVVVKVVRPGIERTIRQDVRLLYTLAWLARALLKDGHRLRPLEVVADYEHTILDELDMQREGANTSQLRRNFLDSELLYVPEVYWDYCSRQVITMERIDGIPCTDIAALKAQNTNLKLLAARGVETFFTQVLRDSFFHADMHPGNVFVSKEHPENPKYIGIDCAIMGTLSEFDQYYLATNLLAVFQRDYREVARLHVESGWVPAGTRIQDFEGAIRSVCEPIFQKPIAELSFGELLLYLFQVARRFDMEVQPSLVLLQKTLLNIEGLGRQLYPELDLWETAMPFIERWVKERYAPQNVAKKLGQRLPAMLEKLPELGDSLIARVQQPNNTLPEKSAYRTLPIKRLAIIAVALALALVLSNAGVDLVWSLAAVVVAALAALQLPPDV